MSILRFLVWNKAESLNSAGIEQSEDMKRFLWYVTGFKMNH